MRCLGRPTTSAPVTLASLGHSGCIETFLSGPGLERDHLHAHGETLTAHEIAARAVTR